MDAQRFLARILFGSLLSVILTPLHGMNNNPPSPEKNSPPPLVTFNSLSMTDHEKSLQRDEDLKQFMYNRTDDEIEKFRSLVEDCKERGMDNNQIKETLMLFAVDQPRQNRPLTVSFTIQSEEQLLSSQAGKTPVISEDESQPLPQNKFSETPQNKIPQVIKEKQSEKNSSFESNLARDRALQNKQRNELQQQANYERGRSQSAQNMNRIAHQYDHLVDDPEIKQEIETLAFDFARGYRHELISEYKKNPYNSNNLRGSYITSGAIERAKKLSPVFASKMNQVPEQYKDRSFGQEIAGGFKSAKTGFKYIFDSKFRKEFDNKEKKRKEEKRQRKQWLSNLPSRELTPEPTRLTPAPIPPISNNNSDSQEETDKQESEELEKKEELEQQQQSKNTGQQKQNEAEQNYGQGKGQAEQQHYVSNLENQQQSEEVSKQYENALNQAHEPKQVKSSSFKRIKTKGWRPPLSLARDEDEEGEEQPERNRDPKQILNREEELQKEKENKEKLDREAEAAELQRKKDAEKKASDEAERKKHVEAEHRHEREKINFELQNLRIQYEIAEQERLRKQQEQEFESQLLERQRQKKDAETQKQNAIAEKQEQERAAQEKAKRQKQEEIAEKQRQENALQKARAEAEQQKLIDQKLEQERLENERKHQEFKSLSSCVENVLESVSNAKSFNELNNATQSIERIKGIASDDFVASLSSLVNTQREKINRAERENIKGRADHAKQLILNARSSNEIDEAVQFFESIRDHISDDSIAAFYSQVERQRKKIEKAEVKSQNRSNSNSNSNYDNKESDYGYQSNNYQYSPYQYSEREVEYRISSILTIPHWQRTPRERSFLNEYRHYTDRVYENTCYKLMDILNTNYYDRSEAEDRFVEQYSWIIPKLEQQLNQEFVEYQRANLNHDNWLYGNKIREILRNTSCQPGYLDRMTLSRNPMLTNLIAKEIEIERQQEQDAKEAREASEEFERQRRLQQQRLTQSNSQSQQSQPVQPTQVQSVNQPPTQSQATNPTPRVSQPAPAPVPQPQTQPTPRPSVSVQPRTAPQATPTQPRPTQPNQNQVRTAPQVQNQKQNTSSFLDSAAQTVGSWWDYGKSFFSPTPTPQVQPRPQARPVPRAPVQSVRQPTTVQPSVVQQQPVPVQPQPTQPEPVQPPPVQPTIITPPVEPQVEPITTPQDQPQLTTEQIEVTFTTSEPETEQIEVAFTTPEPETEPEPQPTRKKAAPKRKSRRRISSSRKKATPKVRPKRKATNQLDNPRPPKKRRLPKQKGTAPTRKQPSRAAKQKAAPNITCTGSGPSVVDKEPSVDVEMLNDEEEDQRAAQEERDVQLARQLQEDDDMNLEDQQARHTPAVLQNLYNQFQERYLVAQQSQDDFTRERSQQRIDAVTQTMENGGTFDYSNMIDAHPIFTDIDAHVFDQCHGTFIDKQLHQELCLTRTTMHQLLEINPGSARVQAFTPMIDHLTALIKQEEDLANAFGLSDYAHDLVQIIAGGINILNTGIDYAEIGVDATLRGMIRGVQNSFDLQHWKEMGLGLLELGVFFANEAADIEAFDNAMISSVVNNNPDILMDTCKDFEQHYRGHTEVLEQTLQQLKNMTWEQLIENGAQFGTTFVLDGVICHAATLAATKAGRALVNELATALNSGTASERVVEIIGVGKIALEEGPEVANTVVETVKKNPEQLAQEGKNSVQVLKEVADDVTGGTKKVGHQAAQIIEEDLAQMYKTTTLGRGSTGRTVPKTLNEQLAMKEVLSDSLSNAKELQSVRMTDPRWLEQDGWAKMSKNVNGIEIHYVYNHKIGAFDDFKFK